MTTESKQNEPAAAHALNPDALAKKIAKSLRPTMRQMVKQQIGEEAVANPGTELSKDALDTLHRVYRQTGDEGLGQILDEMCDDPECEDAQEE